MKKRFYPLVMSVIFTLTSYAQFFDSKNEQEVLSLMQFIDRGVEHFDTIPYMRRDSCTKIVCDQLGGECHLAYVPKHVYIKHIGEDGKWVGVNLENGAFVTDRWFIMTTHISAEAIANGIFLRATSNEELVGRMLLELAIMYIKKHRTYDFFTLLCADIVLEKFPNNFTGLVIKENSHGEIGRSFIRKYGSIPSYLAGGNYMEYRYARDRLDQLGYSEFTDDEYIQWVKEATELVEKENALKNKKK